MSPPSLAESQTAVKTRWLSIVGVGEDGVDGLTAIARNLIRDAEIVFGGERHLELTKELIRGELKPWLKPFDSTLEQVLAQRGRSVCVLASGDPYFHGVGSVIARRISAEEIIAVPSISAFSLAASRLGWSLNKTTLLSLCGRSLDYVRPHLHPGTNLILLMSDAKSPPALSSLLCDLGFGASLITILEALGGRREKIRTSRADQFAFDAIDPLNTCAIEIVADASARIIPYTAGLADDLFEHDGQITKREVRALTLSALAPRHGELLWDIGAGAGSVAIEWMLADPSLTAIAIEQNTDRATRIARNAAAFGVPGLAIVKGAAPAALESLATPDAVFVGGGATVSGVMEAAQSSLRRGGRLVVNAVTLETESILLNRQSAMGGVLTRIEISRASPIGGDEGRMSGWRPAMPVVQWTWVKP